MSEENKPFNDVIDHMNKIEGNPYKAVNTDLNKMPRPIRYIGYFMIGFFSIAFIVMFVLNLLN